MKHLVLVGQVAFIPAHLFSCSVSLSVTCYTVIFTKEDGENVSVKAFIHVRQMGALIGRHDRLTCVMKQSDFLSV